MKRSPKRAGASTTSSGSRSRAGPGLAGALLVGLSAAKAVAWGRRLPLVPVDHLHAHVASLFLADDPLEPPFLCLLASGGHTLLLDVRDHRSFETLGETIDDAAGEAFDKGARLLGLGYPGGPALDRLARDGDPALSASRSHACPASTSPSPASRPRFCTRCATSVRTLDERKADLAASYQRAVVRALVERTLEAAEQTGARADRRRRRRRRELGASRVARGRRASPHSSCAPTTPRWSPLPVATQLPSPILATLPSMYTPPGRLREPSQIAALAIVALAAGLLLFFALRPHGGLKTEPAAAAAATSWTGLVGEGRPKVDSQPVAGRRPQVALRRAATGRGGRGGRGGGGAAMGE